LVEKMMRDWMVLLYSFIADLVCFSNLRDTPVCIPQAPTETTWSGGVN